MTKQRPLHKSRATTYGLSALFVLVAATACGGGGDDPAPTPAPTPAPAPAPGPAPAPAPMPSVVNGGTITATSQVGTNVFAEGATATGGTGQAVAGVSCGPAVQTFNQFTHLSIVRNGEQIAIPGRAGIVRDAGGNLVCVYGIHTHSNDHSGRVHMEGPVPATYTLGQFFSIWGMPLTTSDVAGLGVPLTKVYIVDNNTVSEFTGDPATIEMTSHRHVVLQLGSAITQIPVYSWTGN